MSLQPTPNELGANKANILIVDDTPMNLRLLNTILSDQGYKVRAVVNGAMAITAARSAPPDLILLDITMPDLDGYEVCRRLKQDPITKDVPIIFISALDAVEDKVQAFTVGGVDYITKPFQIEEVMARVQTHLALKDMQRRLMLVNEELEQRVQARTQELTRLNAALEHFVPREFLTYLGRHSLPDLMLGDQSQQEMTVLVNDIRDFTARAEKIGPQATFNFLNEYLKWIGPIIRQAGGFVDQYLGDGLMTLFPGATDAALQAAIQMQQAVERLNHELTGRGEAPLAIGISLHTGSLMLGIIGEAQRWQGTVIADTVNLAHRMDTLTKLYGAPVVLTRQVVQRLQYPEQFHFRYLGRVQLKGKLEATSVYELLDAEPARLALKRASQADFEAGLALYFERKFAEASVRFTQTLQTDPDDRAARLYLQRCAQWMVQGVPPDWQGVEVLAEK